MRIVSFSGRIGRSDYFVANVLLYIVGMAFVVLIVVGGPNAAKDFPSEDILSFLRSVEMPSGLGWILLLTGLAGLLFLGLVAISVSVRRLHDFGLTGFLVLAYPVLNHLIPDQHWPDWMPGPASLLWDLVMIAQPGTRGPNAFGPDPRATAPAEPTPTEPTPEPRPE